MDIKMIAIDLDGTALMPDHIKMSPGLIPALEMAYRKGIAVVPVTGRQFGLMPPQLQKSSVWQTYGIFCNGGQIWNISSGKLCYNLTIRSKELEALLSIAERFHLPIEFSINGKLYLTQKSLEQESHDPKLTFHRTGILSQCGIITESLLPLCQDSQMHVEKVNICCISSEQRSMLGAQMKEIDVSAVWTSDTNLEITHKDATKGKSVQKLCEILGISPANVMAFGDSENDITMLQLAGLGIAMGNAPDFVKQAADFVTKTNTQGGVACAIRRFL